MAEDLDDFTGETQFKIRLSAILRRKLKGLAVAEGLDESKIVRKAIDEYGKHISNKRAFSLPLLGHATGGNWAEAIGEAEDQIEVSGKLADFLDAHNDDNDFFIKVVGDSMAGAGILDGSYVLITLLSDRPPRKGDIVVWQIDMENGESDSTLKRYDKMDPQTGRPVLLDGNDKVFEIPEGVKKITPIAVARGNVNAL